MKLVRKLLLACGAASLAVTPAMAAPTERASQSAEDANEFGSTGLIFVLAAIAVAILAVVAFNNDNDPVSP